MKRLLIFALMVFALAEGGVLASPGQKDSKPSNAPIAPPEPRLKPPPPPPPTHMATGRRQWRSKHHRRQGHRSRRKHAAMLLPGGKDW